MSKRKKWITLILIVIILLGGLFIFQNWELHQINKGNKLPVMWSSVDEYSAEVLRVENPS